MAEVTQKFEWNTTKTRGAMLGLTERPAQDILKQLNADVMNAKKQLLQAQALYTRLSSARLRRIADSVLPDSLNFIETKSAKPPCKLTLVASGLFTVVGIGPDSVFIQRADSSAQNISRDWIARTTNTHTHPIPEPFRALHDHSRSLDLPTCCRSCIFAPHAFTLEERICAARLTVLTAQPHHCTMWNTIVSWTALNFQNRPNKSFPESWTDRNKRKLDASVAYIGKYMIQTLVRGNRLITILTAIYQRTVSAT